MTLERPHPIAQSHAVCEQLVAHSGMAWTFLRPAAFMANDLRLAPAIRARGVVCAPYGLAAAAPIDERDIAAVALRALLTGGPPVCARCRALY